MTAAVALPIGIIQSFANDQRCGSQWLLSVSVASLWCLFKMEDWGGMVQVHDDPQDVDSALGSGREERAVVAIWWD
jgi:hypothetical protein